MWFFSKYVSLLKLYYIHSGCEAVRFVCGNERRRGCNGNNAPRRRQPRLLAGIHTSRLLNYFHGISTIFNYKDYHCLLLLRTIILLLQFLDVLSIGWWSLRVEIYCALVLPTPDDSVSTPINFCVIKYSN